MDGTASLITSNTIKAMSVLTDDGFCLCEIVVDDAGRAVDYRFLAVNRYFEEMTGISDPVGRTALELVPGLERHWVEYYARVGLGRESLRFEDGSNAMGRWFDVFATPVEPPGCFTIVFRDVTARKQLEAEREQALNHSQRLLQELSHRVKNSLGTMASIVSMEMRNRPDDGENRALERVRNRLDAIARLYEQLNHSAEVDTVEMQPYLTDVVGALAAAFDGTGVRVDVEADDTHLPTSEAVCVGLVVNELVTNSVKYAFSGRAEGRVSVTFRCADGHRRLAVVDDGTGIAADAASPPGIGHRLVRAFVDQLGGRYVVESGADGTAAVITF